MSTLAASPTITATAPPETTSSENAPMPFSVLSLFDSIGGPYWDVPGTSGYSSKNQSGLTTQLLVCGGLGLACFLVFCFLRTRWTVILAPRTNMKRHKPPVLPDSLFGWIIPLLRISDQEMLHKVGLDAVVMLQFIAMGVKLFSILSISGAVLIPISVMHGNTTDSGYTEISKLSISALDPSSDFLIAYLVFTYLFCFLTFYFLQQNFRSFVFLRAQYLLHLSKTLTCRSVMVTGIPRPLRSDAALAEFYQHLDIGPVRTTHIVRHVKGLNHLIKKRASALRHLEAAYAQYWGNPCTIPDYDPDLILEDTHLFQRVEQEKSEQNDGGGTERNTTFMMGLVQLERLGGRRSKGRPQIRPGWFNLWGKKVDTIDYYTEKFDYYDKKVQEARQSNEYEPTNVGFVTFETMASAVVASQIAICPEPFNCRTIMAYEPRDILWANVSIRGRMRIVRTVFVWVVTILLSIFWIAPISAFSTLTTLDSLRRVFPRLVDATDDSLFLQNLLQGLVPTLAVNIFMAILPLIFDALGHIQGLRSRSAVAEATFSKYFFFLLFNVLLIFTVASTITKTVEGLINHPTEVANLLGTTLPSVTPFFINYVVLQGMLMMPLRLLLVGALIIRGFCHVFLCKTPRDYAENRAPWSFDYGTGYPQPLLIFIIVFVYSTISPIILLFGAIYFCCAYLVYKYQFLYVYFRPYETAGRAWTMVFPRIIVGMLIFQLTMAGLFILKEYITLGILCVPLIAVTVIFKYTMDSAFRKSSQHLPMQCLRDEMTRLPIKQQHKPDNDDDDNDDDSEDDEDGDHEDANNDVNTIPAVDEQGTSKEVDQKQTRHLWMRAADIASALSTNSQKASSLSLQRHARPRRRAVMIDEDDYEAIPDRRTDYRQPPMLLNPGILDTGLKRFGNPAIVGLLPQLWLPVKAPIVGSVSEPLAPHKRLSSMQQINALCASDLARLLRHAESAKQRVGCVLDHQVVASSSTPVLGTVGPDLSSVYSATHSRTERNADETHGSSSILLRQFFPRSASFPFSRTRNSSESQMYMLNDTTTEQDTAEVEQRGQAYLTHTSKAVTDTS